MITDRLPPNNKGAEQAVIGSLLRESRMMPDALELLDENSFYFNEHRLIFRAMVELQRKNVPIDMVTVAEAMGKTGMDDIGGAPYLAAIWDGQLSAASLTYYADIVRDKAMKRQVIHSCNQSLRDAYDEVCSGDDLVSAAQREFMAIGFHAKTAIAHKLSDVMREVQADIDRQCQRVDGEIEGIETGLLELDQLTGGLRNGELAILAARPSIGKTSLAIKTGHNAAAHGMPVLMVSLEQSRLEIGARLMCAESGISSLALRGCSRTKPLPADKVARLYNAGHKLAELPIFINDTASQHVRNIIANARRLKAKEGIRLVIVDYLQLISPEDRRLSRNEQVAEISRGLKLLARELEVPVLALSQLSREVDKREDKRPRLSDLRDSGSIEQDADTVIFLWRPESGGRDTAAETETIGAIVAKQRNGPCGDVELRFRKKTMRFENRDIAEFDRK